MPYNQDRLDQPVNIDLFWRNRRPSTTPIIYLAGAPDLATVNLKAFRSPLNAPDRCRARMQHLADLYRTAKRNETAYGPGAYR